MIAFRVQPVAITSSTNDDAKQAAEAGEAERLVIWALRQTSGRGRQDRVWESPEGNLYCSVLLRPDAGSPRDSTPLPEGEDAKTRACISKSLVFAGEGLESTTYLHQNRSLASLCEAPSPYGRGNNYGCYSFVAALAIRDFVKEQLPHAMIKLKWPNDVLVEGKKISGILLEVSGDALIVGMGINVTHHPENTIYPTISLREVGADACELSDLLDRLLRRLGHWYDIMQREGFEPVRQEWLEHAQKGKMNVCLPHEIVQGEFVDLVPNGILLVRLADGSERAIATGDVFFG